MHLANLATVFGPTLLRKPTTSPGMDGYSLSLFSSLPLLPLSPSPFSLLIPHFRTGFDATVFSMVVDTPAINELCMSMIEDYDYIFEV
jgi:hypothetical protein